MRDPKISYESRITIFIRPEKSKTGCTKILLARLHAKMFYEYGAVCNNNSIEMIHSYVEQIKAFNWKFHKFYRSLGGNERKRLFDHLSLIGTNLITPTTFSSFLISWWIRNPYWDANETRRERRTEAKRMFVSMFPMKFHLQVQCFAQIYVRTAETERWTLLCGNFSVLCLRAPNGSQWTLNRIA